MESERDGKMLGDRSGEQGPQDGRLVDVGVTTTGKREESDNGGRLVIPKLKEPNFSYKVVVVSDLHGSWPVMIAEDRN